MKTIKMIFAVAAFCLPTFAFSQKTAYPVKGVNPINIAQKQVRKKAPFRAQLTVSNCFVGAQTVTARITASINKGSAYSFMWEVDGVPHGHNNQISCVTGKVATVHIREYPSGNRITQSIKLRDDIYNE